MSNYKKIFLIIAIAVCVFMRVEETRAGGGVVTMAVVGDMMFDRGVRVLIERDGVERLFSGSGGILKSADIAAGNLECPLTDRVAPIYKKYVFRCDPAMAGELAAVGFDALALANNHTLDQGRGGLMDTIANLRAAGVAGAGAGANAAAAARPVFIEKNGVKIAFLSFSTLAAEGISNAPRLPGVAMADEAAVRAAVADAKERADAVVVFFHWGREFSAKPDRAQVDMARAAVDSGAALVAGSHPHVMQTIERRNGALIVYSLGNFIFDQDKRGADTSAILLVSLSSKGVTGQPVFCSRSSCAMYSAEYQRQY